MDMRRAGVLPQVATQQFASGTLMPQHRNIQYLLLFDITILKPYLMPWDIQRQLNRTKSHHRGTFPCMISRIPPWPNLFHREFRIFTQFAGLVIYFLTDIHQLLLMRVGTKGAKIANQKHKTDVDCHIYQWKNSYTREPLTFSTCHTKPFFPRSVSSTLEAANNSTERHADPNLTEPASNRSDVPELSQRAHW